ncbi:MAG TPA: hypothetical protein VH598_03745 [Verrucomicrobiae bacterium]|nr:hypothetical protein [Verrucomicrobiae bacterium]
MTPPATTQPPFGSPAPGGNARTAVFKPAPPPVLKTTGSKEQRLDDLLRLYKADQITPLEYHVQRAKIIAGP